MKHKNSRNAAQKYQKHQERNKGTDRIQKQNNSFQRKIHFHQKLKEIRNKSSLLMKRI